MSSAQIKKKLIETIQLHQNGAVREALKGYKNILKKEPANLAAKMFYGVALEQDGKSAQALKVLNEVLKVAPQSADIYYHLSSVYQSMARLDDAHAAIDQALQIKPDSAVYLSRRAKVLVDEGKPDQGLQDALRALEIQPDYIEALLHTGICYSAMAMFDDAMAMYKKVLSLSPSNAEAANNIGSLYMTFEKYDEAIDWFAKAMELRPDYGSAHNNIAVCYYQTAEQAKALHHFDKALEYKVGDAGILANKAGVLRHIGHFDDAVALFEKALKLNPNLPHVHSNYLMALHYIPDLSRKKIYDAHIAYDKKFCAELAPKDPIKFDLDHTTDKKLRVGMVSANFNRHPVGYMILPALDHMDKNKVEFYTYSDLRTDKNDDFTARIKGNSAQWHDTLGVTDVALYEKIKNDNIDILLDLTGHAEGGGRLPVFARRAAPVQVEWIGGLFDTSGLSEMDWIIGDAIEIPEGDDKWYSEQVYRMPDDYVCYEPPHYAADVGPLPALENGFVTFGNLNNPAKINDFSIRLWSKVLMAVPNSKMLFSSRAFSKDILRDRVIDIFSQNDIGVDRLILEEGAGHIDFVATYNRIDIALDPYPYSGGLTTCEALWMGTPVITVPGETFAGRHAATHLYNAGMKDWIAETEDDYVDLAVRWAQNLKGLSELRLSLREKVRGSPLTDGVKFARNLEIAFRTMWKDWAAEKHD